MVAPDDFQLHEWLFVTDTVDAVYRTAAYRPVALVDELSEELGNGPDAGAGALASQQQQGDESANTPYRKRRPLLLNTSADDPLLVASSPDGGNSSGGGGGGGSSSGVGSSGGGGGSALAGALAEDVLDEGLAGLVAAADEGPAGDVEEAHVEGAAAPGLELGGRDVALDLEVALRRAHVLAEGDDVDAGAAQLAQRVAHLGLLLAEPQHQARLGHDALGAPHRLHVLEHAQALPKVRPPVPHVRRQALHRLHVVRVHVHAALGHDPHRVQVAHEVARQRLDQQARLLGLDAPHRLREVARPAVRHVVPVDVGQHHVAQAPAGESSGGGLRFVLTLQNRHPRVHVSPISMMVAVAAFRSLPPQHSEMLGHRASSHTVCRPSPRRSDLIFL